MKNKEKSLEKTLAVIDEIHEKVLSAGEKCLQEAQKILSTDNSKKLCELSELARVGFSNSKEVKEADKKIKDIQLATEKAKLVQYYATHYPQKYILTEDMDKICEEYGLFLGSDEHYLGSIPDRSRKEIVAFKLRENDHIYYRGKTRIIEAGIKTSKAVIDWAEIDKDDYMKETKNGKNLIQNRDTTHYICNNDYFMIAAPMDMFDMKGLVAEGHKLREIIELEDPIALKPVKYGYLIASVWGHELAIAKVRNEREN